MQSCDKYPQEIDLIPLKTIRNDKGCFILEPFKARSNKLKQFIRQGKYLGMVMIIDYWIISIREHNFHRYMFAIILRNVYDLPRQCLRIIFPAAAVDSVLRPGWPSAHAK